MDYLRGHALHEIFLNKQTVKEKEKETEREREDVEGWYGTGWVNYGILLFFFFGLGSLQTIVNDNVFFRQQV